MSYGAMLRKREGNSSDTIAGKFAAIMDRWGDLGYEGPPITSYRTVKKFLRGSLRRQGGPTIDVREACTSVGLNKMFSRLSMELVTNLKARAWLSVAWSGGFRGGEWKNLQWRDLKWMKDDVGFFLRTKLRKQKTMMYRSGNPIVDIVNSPHMKSVTYFWKYWKHLAGAELWDVWVQNHSHEFVFATKNGGKLTSRQTKPYFNLYALLNGCEVSHMTCHSLRYGSVTEMAQRNACDSALRAHGRWSEHSASFSRYVRPDYQAKRKIRRTYL